MAPDEKYELRNNRIFHKLGGYYIPSDEPLIIFRGKDPDAIAAMEAYIKHTDSIAENSEAKDHNESMTRKLQQVREWQNNNPSRVRRGCHKCQGEPTE